MPDTPKRLKWQHGLAFGAIVAFVVALDQLSKEWIRTHLAIGESMPEVMHLTIIHLRNSGSAFGLFTNQAFLLSVLAIVGLALVLIFFRYFAPLGFAGGIALSLIFGGALGNLIDRMRLGGYVTDFIYFRLWDSVYWPAFNVADSAITIGSVLLAVVALIKYRKTDESQSKARDKGASSSQSGPTSG